MLRAISWQRPRHDSCRGVARRGVLRARSYLLAPVQPPMHASLMATHEGEECVRSPSKTGNARLHPIRASTRQASIQRTRYPSRVGTSVGRDIATYQGNPSNCLSDGPSTLARR